MLKTRFHLLRIYFIRNVAMYYYVHYLMYPHNKENKIGVIIIHTGQESINLPRFT